MVDLLNTFGRPDQDVSVEVLEQWSNVEIFDALRQLGFPAGPVIPETRNVYVKKLKNLLKEVQQLDREEHFENGNVDNNDDREPVWNQDERDFDRVMSADIEDASDAVEQEQEIDIIDDDDDVVDGGVEVAPSSSYKAATHRATTNNQRLTNHRSRGDMDFESEEDDIQPGAVKNRISPPTSNIGFSSRYSSSSSHHGPNRFSSISSHVASRSSRLGGNGTEKTAASVDVDHLDSIIRQRRQLISQRSSANAGVNARIADSELSPSSSGYTSLVVSCLSSAVRVCFVFALLVALLYVITQYDLPA